MRLNHHGNFKVQRFQLFEQIKKEDCAPNPTVPPPPSTATNTDFKINWWVVLKNSRYSVILRFAFYSLKASKLWFLPLSAKDPADYFQANHW